MLKIETKGILFSKNSRCYRIPRFFREFSRFLPYMGEIRKGNAFSTSKLKERDFLTKSYISCQNMLPESWEQNIVARKLTIRNISNQLKYNLNIYIEENQNIVHVIIFLFLGIIQLFFYTFGAFTVKMKYNDMPSLQ